MYTLLIVIFSAYINFSTSQIAVSGIESLEQCESEGAKYKMNVEGQYEDLDRIHLAVQYQCIKVEK